MTTRRKFFAGLGALPLGASLAQAAPAEARKVHVTGIEIIPVLVEKPGKPTTWLFVRLQTDAGVTGLGEASHGYNDTKTAKLCQELLDAFKGKSIFDVEFLRSQALPIVEREKLSGAVAFSGFEHAIWDLQGKVLGLPCYDLFGGALRTEIRNYANINRSTEPRTPEAFAKMAAKAVAAGFDAVKLAPFDGTPKNDAEAAERHTQMAIETLRQVRAAIGPDRDLLTDVHSQVSLERGLKLVHELEFLKLFWVEEVPKGRNVADSAKVTAESAIPHAGGESVFGVKGFFPFIAAHSWDIMMPDVKYCGGMAELKKIAAASEGAGRPVSPHGPASPVGNLAAGHVCATLPNFLILEHAFGEVPWRAEIVTPAEPMRGGTLVLPNRPGLGVELNEKLVKKFRQS